jgi:TPP-dependent pyruvate/acetoin dehydrogenase alpha subunit
VRRAEAYGFQGVSVDGNDAEAMFEATRAARARAVAGEGPTLIEAVTMRMHGHAAHDDMKYVPAEQVQEWKQRDPIERQEKRLAGLGVDVEALRAEVAAELDAAVAEALAGPMPAPDEVLEGIFCTTEPAPLGDGQAPWSGFAAGGGRP